MVAGRTGTARRAEVKRAGISREQVIGVFFVLLGLALLFFYVPRLAGDEQLTTRLNFGTNTREVQAPFIELPTRPTMVVIGCLNLLGGLLAVMRPRTRLSSTALWLCGLLLIPSVLIAAAAGRQTNVLTMLSESLRLATPLALGALAGIFSERAGVVNIGIEGMMLTGACFGFLFYIVSGNIWIGVLGAVAIGGLIALLHGVISITFKTDQIISGTVINVLAIGVTGFVRRSFLMDAGGQPLLPNIAIPGLSSIPLIGQELFNNKPIFYTMIVLLFVTQFALFSTRWGLRTRAVGENPRAADTVGINVGRTRYLAVLLSGMVAGLAGAWFSLETVGRFDDLMTNGKGFISLAAMIFGKWMPFGSFGGAMLFGFSEALGTRFQLLNVPLPSQFLQILPYVVTIIVLAGVIGRAVAPAAVGRPYEK
jgi:general nucleoside transport system permease protein